MYREVEFRAKKKKSNIYVYGSLIIQKKKLSVQDLDKEVFEYKYSIKYLNKNGKYSICEVEESTIGQYIGDGEYGRIYEGMKLYDEYAEEECTIEYDESGYMFRLYYDNYSELIESLDGLRIIEEE